MFNFPLLESVALTNTYGEKSLAFPQSRFLEVELDMKGQKYIKDSVLDFKFLSFHSYIQSNIY